MNEMSFVDRSCCVRFRAARYSGPNDGRIHVWRRATRLRLGCGNLGLQEHESYFSCHSEGDADQRRRSLLSQLRGELR